MKKYKNLAQKAKSLGQNLLLNVSLLLVFTLSWLNLAPASAFMAQATILEQSPLIIALESNPVDQTVGAGTTDKIKGKVERDIGATQKNIGKFQGQAEGAAREARGKAQQDLGEAKGRAEGAGSNLGKASDNLIEGIKDLFGQ